MKHLLRKDVDFKIFKTKPITKEPSLVYIINVTSVLRNKVDWCFRNVECFKNGLKVLASVVFYGCFNKMFKTLSLVFQKSFKH